jgi:hypothetical protein
MLSAMTASQFPANRQVLSMNKPVIQERWNRDGIRLDVLKTRPLSDLSDLIRNDIVFMPNIYDKAVVVTSSIRCNIHKRAVLFQHSIDIMENQIDLAQLKMLQNVMGETIIEEVVRKGEGLQQIPLADLEALLPAVIDTFFIKF